MSDARRLQLGSELYAAVPADQARALAGLVRWALEEVGRRDGIAPPGYLLRTLRLLEEVQSEREANLLVTGGAGSARRTAEPPDGSGSSGWGHDEVTVADAVALTGWSAGYLCRLGRAGLGRKQAGVWRLDRRALLELRRPA